MNDAELGEFKRRRLLLEDCLLECGLNKAALVEAFRQHLFQLNRALFGSATGVSRHGLPPWSHPDPTMTPNLAKRARQRALDHLDVLCDGHRDLQISQAFDEARPIQEQRLAQEKANKEVRARVSADAFRHSSSCRIALRGEAEEWVVNALGDSVCAGCYAPRPVGCRHRYIQTVHENGHTTTRCVDCRAPLPFSQVPIAPPIVVRALVNAAQAMTAGTIKVSVAGRRAGKKKGKIKVRY